MQCPGCQQEMSQYTVGAALGTAITVDLCRNCRAFWFDPYEDLKLTSQSTLRLFQIISESRSATAAFPAAPVCPDCQSRLLLTHDRQRNTAFVYWRCDSGHGRFMPFAEFLREKDFIREPSPQQMAELRRSIQMIRCSSCGAPIDLMHASACGHCGAAVSILDVKRLAELAGKAGSASAVPPPARLLPPKLTSSTLSSAPTLIDLGFDVLADWLIHLL
jgi:Zn-finger nucleic acid-binding protein